MLVIGGYSFQAADSLGDGFLHLADPSQVGINIPLSLLIEDLLAVYKNFHNALAARGDGYRRIRSIGPEEFIRHPRGGSVVLSRYAVSNLYLNFAFHKVLLINPTIRLYLFYLKIFTCQGQSFTVTHNLTD